MVSNFIKIASSVLAMVFLIGPVVAAPSNDFIGGEIFEQALQYIDQNEIAEGYSDGEFHGEYRINRAEFLKMITASIDLPLKEDVSDCFADLQFGAWYVPHVCSIKDEGWIQGYPDGTFRPEKNVTLIEAVKIILLSHNIPLDHYDDHSGTEGEWHEPYLPKAYEIGFFSDILEGHALDEPLYRGEVAQMLYLLDLWKEDYQQEWEAFQNYKSSIDESSVRYLLEPGKYPQPWSMHSDLIDYRSIGEFHDANGMDIPLAPGHRNVHLYGDYLTFSYPYGNVLSVDLKTLSYRFDQLPADFSEVYFNGTYYLVKTSDYCEFVDSHLSSKEFCAIKIYDPKTGEIYHVRSKADSVKDDPWDEASVVTDIKILDSGDEFLLLRNVYYECHGAGGCFPNRYYYTFDENGVALASMVYSSVDEASNQLYLGIKVYSKGEMIREDHLLTGIDEDQFYDGLLNPESQYRDLADQLRLQWKQLYDHFYVEHGDLRRYLHESLFDLQYNTYVFEFDQDEAIYELPMLHRDHPLITQKALENFTKFAA